MLNLNPQTWLIGGLCALLALGGAFGAGFYAGDTHNAKIVAAASARAAQDAAARQADADAKQAAHDRAIAVADASTRARADQAAEDAAHSAQAAIPSLLPPPKPSRPVNGVCPAPAAPIVPAAVLRSLNDPAIIGGP